MQGRTGPGRAAYAATRRAPQEDAALSFKRFILERTAGFEREPMADLARVQLLGEMLDRYDEFRRSGASEGLCVQRVLREYADIAGRMAQAGAQRRPSGAGSGDFLSEAEADAYLRQSSDRAHKTAIGVGLCAACCAPLMATMAFDALLGYAATDVLGLFGLIGMFAMIALGVYSITTARKPDQYEDVKRGRFSLTGRLRKRLTALRERTRDAARKRRARGIALCVACVIPILAGAVVDSLLYLETFSMLGVGGMFLMIGAGVYEITVADGEKKAVERLLKG